MGLIINHDAQEHMNKIVEAYDAGYADAMNDVLVLIRGRIKMNQNNRHPNSDLRVETLLSLRNLVEWARRK